MISGIYIIGNLKNAKIYIGKSKDVYSRINSHLSSLRRDAHKNSDLQDDFNKYGEENFEFKLIHECHPLELDRYESIACYEINTFNAEIGYNHPDTKYSMLDYRNITDEIMEEVYIPYFTKLYDEVIYKVREKYKIGDFHNIGLKKFLRKFSINNNDAKVIIKLMKKYEDRVGLSFSIGGYNTIHISPVWEKDRKYDFEDRSYRHAYDKFELEIRNLLQLQQEADRSSLS